MWEGAEVKKTARLTHGEIRKQLIESMVVNEVIESNELSKQAEEVKEDPKEAADVIKQYRIINIVFHQGKVFKRFKEKDKLITLFNQFNIHKTTIIFKINVYKLCEKYPKLLKSSVGLGVLKNYHKYIKQICEENEQEFS